MIRSDTVLNYELISEGHWGHHIYKNGDRAIKIFPSGTLYSKAAEIARVQSLVYEAGLPVPCIYGVQRLNDGKIAFLLSRLIK